MGQWIDPDFATKSAADAAASCSACRGYMWANQHPAPTKFRPLRAPLAPVVARATAHNRAELVERVTQGLGELQPAGVVSVQTVPYAKVVAQQFPAHAVRAILPMCWRKLWKGKIEEEYGGGVECAAAGSRDEAVEREQAADDEIED